MQPVPVTVNGVTYPSKTEAAKALGMCISTLYNRERSGIDLGSPVDERRMPFKKKLRIGNKRYKSHTAAAKALGINLTTLSERVKRGIKLDAPLMKTRPKRKHASA